MRNKQKPIEKMIRRLSGQGAKDVLQLLSGKELSGKRESAGGRMSVLSRIGIVEAFGRKENGRINFMLRPEVKEFKDLLTKISELV